MENRALKLLITKGPREGDEVEFKPGSRIRIGRVVRGNNVAIKDAGISSKHISIELDSRSGSWILQDLGSSNGTFINGSSTALSPDTPYAINDGDSINIGEFSSILCKLDCEPELPKNPPPRRGRAAATRVLKEGKEKLGSKEAGALESVVDLVSTTSMKDVENVVSEKEKMEQTRVSPRRTRGRKRIEEKGSVAISVIEEKSKRTRASSRRKGNKEKDVTLLEDAEKQLDPVVEETQNDLIADKENVEEVSNLGEDLGKQELNKEEPNFGEGDLGGIEKGYEAANNGNVMEEDNSGPSRLDLSKLTVREWFDYLEVYLPKQIIDETEKSLAAMRDKVERVKEYVKEQRMKKKGDFEQTAQ